MYIRDLLIQPNCIKHWTKGDWDIAVQQGYATGMLARMYSLLKNSGLSTSIPIELNWHFTSAYKLFCAHKLDVTTEISFINKALSFGNIKPIYLKGAAYQVAEDLCADGRLFVDIDIYVDKSKITEAEQLLKWHGWQGSDLDEHDEKYYRNWMHEIPALTHQTRNMVVDVHHNLIPLTSKIKLDGNTFALNAKKSKVSDELVLDDVDRILHSALHMLLDSEFDKGFRDLSDIDILLKQSSNNNDFFWDSIICRAKELKIERILYYVLKQSKDIFLTPIPEKTFKELEVYKATFVVDKVTNFFFSRVLVPKHDSCQLSLHAFSAKMLFLRSHWIKMPIHILVPHLFYKSFITPYNEWKEKEKLQQDNMNG